MKITAGTNKKGEDFQVFSFWKSRYILICSFTDHLEKEFQTGQEKVSAISHEKR